MTIRKNILKILLLGVICLLQLQTVSFGQQQSVLTQYNFNPMIFNPAYSGFEKDAALMLTYRKQWANVEGTPSTAYLSGTTRLKNNKHGIGATFLSDRYGVSSTSGFNFSYSYKIINDTGNYNDNWNFKDLSLSLGLMGGIEFYSEKYSELEVTNDPKFANDISFITPGLGIGAYFAFKNFFGGVSSPRVWSTTLNQPDGIELNRQNHWYILGGKVFDVNENLKLKASFLAKDVSGGPAQIDFLANALIKESFEVGAGFRSNSSVNLMAGYHLKNKAWFGYSYDVSVVPEIPGNSHEITLKIKFGDKQPPPEPKRFDDEPDSLYELDNIDTVSLEDSLPDGSADSLGMDESALKKGSAEQGISPAVLAAPIVAGAIIAGDREGEIKAEDPGSSTPTLVVAPIGIKALSTSEKGIISQKIFFKFNSDKLLTKSEKVLDSVALILNNHPDIRLKVIGHTCNIGSEGQNAGISKDRAIVVKNYLVRKGVQSGRLVTIGKGYSQPYLPNINERFRKMNRRVEFKPIVK